MPLTPEIEAAIRAAHEATLNYQRLKKREREARWHETNEWIESLRNDPAAFNAWYEPILRSTRERTSAEKARTAEEQRLRDEAHARAEKLLLELLTPQQKVELQRRNYFHVRVGATRYRITRGVAGNVLEVDNRSRIRFRFCAHPNENVPVPDVMLAQKLLIETEPERFFSLANRRQGRRHTRRPA